MPSRKRKKGVKNSLGEREPCPSAYKTDYFLSWQVSAFDRAGKDDTIASGEDMRMTQNKVRLFAGLFALSALFLYLRMRTVGHLLMWDEAWNILSLRAYLTGATGNPFYWFYRFHPPLYMAFAGFLAPFRDGFALRLEWLSLIFAYATFLVVYFLGARIGGWRYAWFTGAFLSCMPASIGYDTWIKRDGLASFFGYLALLLLLKKRIFWCAVSLAFSLLSKENGLFFVLSAFIMVFMLGEEKPLRKISLMALVIFAFASWWYIFFSEMTTHGFQFFFSKAEYSLLWANTAFYYAKKLLPDLGPSILFFLAIGAFSLFFKTFARQQAKWFLPAAVALCVYVPISLLFVLKVPWLSLAARPALAMIGASGALYLLRRSRKHVLALLVLCAFLAFSFYSAFSFPYADYHRKTYPNGWPGARSSRELALFLNDRMSGGDKLLITEFEYWQMPTCPVFLHYWDPHTIVRIIKRGEKAEDLADEIAKNNISWLVIVETPLPESDFRALSRDMRSMLKKEGEIVGWSRVWNTEALWKKDETPRRPDN